MSRKETQERVFENKAEAVAFADKWRQDMWAYDGSTQVYERDGQWIVYMSSRDSCD